MLMHSDVGLTIPQMDNLFPHQPCDSLRGKAEEVLHSHMITGFEEALGLGMSPMEALGQVLCWVASEMVRIKTAQGPEDTASTLSPEAVLVRPAGSPDPLAAGADRTSHG